MECFEKLHEHFAPPAAPAIAPPLPKKLPKEEARCVSAQTPTLCPDLEVVRMASADLRNTHEEVEVAAPQASAAKPVIAASSARPAVAVEPLAAEEPEVTKGTSADGAVASDEEGTAVGNGELISPIGSEAGSLTSTEQGTLTSTICHVSVVCDCTKPGECLAVLGADAALGGWDTKNCVPLSTSADAFPTWSADVLVPAAGSEYKLVIVRADGGITWEPIETNRTWPANLSGGALGSYGKCN